jgi:hypothetical protein
MSAKTEMLAAREALALAIDAKFPNLPEWKAIRAIDRALVAMEAESVESRPESGARARLSSYFDRAARVTSPSYADLGVQALTERNSPIPTPEMVEFVGKHRKLGDDPEKAKINITTSLSKDPRIRSVPWENGRAWWFADREPPRNDPELQKPLDEMGSNT